MAEKAENVPVVRPRVAAWKVKEKEAELFASVSEVPNWKLADKCRRLLMDLNYKLTARIPTVDVDRLADVKPLVAKQVAITTLAGVTIRASGSAMALISTGYVPESAGPARRGLEARLRARAVLDDDSGQHAREWLSRPMSGWRKLADRYGVSDDLELMSIFAHADARGLVPLYAGPPGGTGDGEVREVNVDLRPARDTAHASNLLYALAYEAVSMCATLVEPFAVAFEIPPWISAELIRLKEERQGRGAE